MAKAYGFIEVASVTAAVHALDLMCKAADVGLVTWEKKLGGRLVTIIVEGNIAAVQTAVEAAIVHGIKKPVASGVLANPHEEIVRLVKKSAKKMEAPINMKPRKKKPKPEPQPKTETVPITAEGDESP